MWRIHGKKHLPYDNTFPTPNSYFAKTLHKLYYINMSIAIVTFCFVAIMISVILLKYTYFNNTLETYGYYDIEEN